MQKYPGLRNWRSQDEINAYVASGEPMDKAGAYAVQGIASLFIEKTEGDYWGIVGLPLFSINKDLTSFNIELLPFTHHL